MDNTEIEAFVTSLQDFFDKLDDKSVNIGTPFLIDDINSYLLDYTGVISITGNHKGTVFFTASKLMTSRMLQTMGVVSTVEEKQMDLVGEVCNTVSGNVRREFGENFLISTPIVMQGHADTMKVSNIKDIYLIPVVWNSLKSNLIINIKESKS